MGGASIRRLIIGAVLAGRHGALRLCLCASMTGLLGLGVYTYWIVQNGNFHAVVAGELYRSGQPRPGELALHSARYGIRTVINLRGANPGRDWYRSETAEARLLGMTFVDFRMKSSRTLAPTEVEQLIALLATAEKPILVHCNGGADRAGLASALYLAAVKGTSEEEAEAQLSLRYGHLAWPILPGFAMDKTFEANEPSFGYPRS